MSRGLGLATATTSAAFFPHREQRNLGASALSVVDRPQQARQDFWCDVTRGAARAAHAHQELPEAVVELLDVSEHTHWRMVRGGVGRVYSALGKVGHCMPLADQGAISSR
jgi:hypothetical protein